jgi:hypothetical protein
LRVHTVDIASLPASHKARLEWFASRSGTNQAFPDPIDHGPLVTRAKGIYKPAGLPHALSCRVMLTSPYLDKTVEWGPNRSWALRYFQEDPDPSRLMSAYTNRGMVRCQEDGVPVGVLVQTQAKPAQYDILGLALVTSWESGLFVLESAHLI